MQPCAHQGCGFPSATGYWCKDCIEFEWPHLKKGGDNYWLVTKCLVSEPVSHWRSSQVFYGFMKAPYKKGEVTFPFGNSFWFPSFLGALSEIQAIIDRFGYLDQDIYLGFAVVRSDEVYLNENLIFVGSSPAYVVEILPLNEFPVSPKEARDILEDSKILKGGDREELLSYILALESNFYSKIKIPSKINLPSNFLAKKDLEKIFKLANRLAKEAEKDAEIYQFWQVFYRNLNYLLSRGEISDLRLSGVFLSPELDIKIHQIILEVALS